MSVQVTITCLVNARISPRRFIMTSPARIAKRLIATSLIALFAATAASSAIAADTSFEKNHPRRAQVNDRLEHQNQRIRTAVKEGRITKAEARRLHRKDQRIRKQERLMARQHNGHITKAEQRVLNRQEDQVSRQIGK